VGGGDREQDRSDREDHERDLGPGRKVELMGSGAGFEEAAEPGSAPQNMGQTDIAAGEGENGQDLERNEHHRRGFVGMPPRFS
jgi:hypothetical protein